MSGAACFFSGHCEINNHSINQPLIVSILHTKFFAIPYNGSWALAKPKVLKARQQELSFEWFSQKINRHQCISKRNWIWNVIKVCALVLQLTCQKIFVTHNQTERHFLEIGKSCCMKCQKLEVENFYEIITFLLFIQKREKIKKENVQQRNKLYLHKLYHCHLLL